MAKKASKKTDLNSLSLQDLNDKIQEAGLRLKKMEFSHAITPIDNPMSIRTLRREIAKYKTAVRKQQLGF
ncbi:MAG: 50S ribosomal protein L29 [Chitinophagaceae bacterium]